MSPDEQIAYDTWHNNARPLLAEKKWTEALKGVPSLPNLEPAIPHPLKGPLSSARIALVTSAGLSGPGQSPFDGENEEGDYTIRVLERDTPQDQISIWHTHFDPQFARQDLNTVYPMDRLLELANEGFIGSVASQGVSFMGYFTNVFRIRDEVIPAVVEAVQTSSVDAALLVPV